MSTFRSWLTRTFPLRMADTPEESWQALRPSRTAQHLPDLLAGSVGMAMITSATS